MADSNQIKTSVQKALASANIDSAKAERIASSLQETIAWLQSDETTATHKKAAQYAVDHPEALAPVAQGLAEGHKDFNYASGALIDRYITSLIRAGAGSKGTYKIELDRTKRDLLDRNGSGFMSALLRHASMETIPELRRELQKSGYDLSKAELLYKAHDRYPNMICNNGDSSKTPLANFKDISKALVENNDRLSVAEWKTDFRLDSSSYNFITYAARLGKLDAVFYPEYWAHHLDEMNEVWKLVPDEHRKQVDIEALRAQVTELSTPDPVLQRGLTRQQLLAPTGNGKPLLADKRVLENFPAVAALLDLQREHLSKSDLAPYMEKFIEAGQFKTVSENLAAHGDSFSKAELLPYFKKIIAAVGFEALAKQLRAQGEPITYAEAKEHKLIDYYKNDDRLALLNRENPEIDANFGIGEPQPLLLAVIANDTELAKRIADKIVATHSEDPNAALEMFNASTRVYFDAVTTAGRLNNAELAGYLKDKRDDILVQRGKSSDFLTAIDGNSEALIQKFIAARKIDLAGPEGEQALMHAMRHPPVFDMLVNAGANPASAGLMLYAAINRHEDRALKILGLLKQAHKDEPEEWFKALTVSDSYSIYQYAKERAPKLAQALVDEVKAMEADIAEFKPELLKATKADIHLKQMGLGRMLTESMSHQPHKRVAIVGAGFAGTVTAIHLLRKAKQPLEIMMVEKSEKRRSGGIAFSTETTNPNMLTSRPAGEMSAFSEDRDDLLKWLKSSQASWKEEFKDVVIEANRPIPLQLYQRYLDARLKEAATASESSLVTKLGGEVVDVVDEGKQATITMADGTNYAANQVILATGLSTAKEIPATKPIKESKRYIADQYTAEGQARLKTVGKDEPVLILGSSLSAYSAALNLIHQGHTGTITMLSRGGHTPPTAPDKAPEKYAASRPVFMDAKTLPELVAGIRKDFWNRTAREGISPTRVVESYEKYVPELIKRFDGIAVRDLINEHGSLANALRLGAPADMSEKIENGMIDGAIKVLAGNVHEMKEQDGKITVRYTPSGTGRDETLEVGHVISCVGRDSVRDELWQNLLARGQAQLHPTRQGIQVADGGGLRNALDQASQTIIAVGTMRNGDTMARNGSIGPQAQSVPGMREQMEMAASLALAHMEKQDAVEQSVISQQPKVKTSTITRSDASGRVHYEIDLNAEGIPQAMRVSVGAGGKTLTEEHTKGSEEGSVNVVRYIDGEAQSPVTKYIGQPGFVSWDDVYLQKPHESLRTKPLILTTAHTGARYSPWQKGKDGKEKAVPANFFAQHMPISPKEIIEDAVKAYDAGARFIHLHARNPETGVQHADAKWYKEVTKGIRRRCPGVVLSFPTSRKGEVGPEIEAYLASQPSAENRAEDIERRAQIEVDIRASGLEAYPDTLTTFTVPEMKIFGEPKNSKGVEHVPGWTDPEVMQSYFRKINAKANEMGIGQEIEITTMGEFDVLDQLVARKDEFNFQGPLHVVLLLGFSDGLPIDRATYDTALERIQQLREATGFDISVSCGAVIRPEEAALKPGTLPKDQHDYKEVMQWVAHDDRVDAFRVGLEDTPKMYGVQQTNAGLLAQARNYFENQGVEIELDPSKVRQKFNRAERVHTERPVGSIQQLSARI